ncbi:hypothetical protein GCM10007916_07940 [Psychromonas marina]|uniref:DUF7939 domain-containing protein n=1 Tax=Psychromonas marina TaxID=88364 RepID=A0ABQ6DXB3_9GAMM|nr:BatD family protein [Psychromonas marina]GLS89727.1 hypothetical protein GCM10007916_07940 [Psychromonas marina]
MKSKFSLLGLLLITLLTSFPLFAAPQVSATVSDNQVVKGDLFILTISVNDSDDDYQLDTRPLEQSFTVYRPSQSKRSEYINGDFSQQTTWQVRLQARELGKLTIPSLKIGDLSTQAIDINVVEAAQMPLSAEQQRIVFMENSIDKQDVYIGQSFILTTKLYISKNSNQLDLAAPQLEGAEVSVFGEDNNNQTVRNGIRYNTITRQYKIIPTTAGTFDIDSPLLTGTLRKVVAVSEWQNKVIADPINVRGERLSINVKAKPEDYQGEWLVSDDLRLLEDNDLSAQSYKVGEPITRSITLQIASIDKDKLPNIKLNYPKSLRVYPDQDQLDEGQANGLTYAVRTIRHAIIADTEGDLILPEITLNWFNSQTNQQETATLPAQTLTILPADKQAAITPIQQSSNQQAQPTIIVDDSALIYWQLAVAVLLFIMLLMVLYHLSFRRLQANNQKQQTLKVAPLNHHYLTLQNSFNKNSATATYSALLSFAQQQFPMIKSVSEFADKTALDQDNKQQLKDEIQWLQVCCSDPSQHWDAQKLAMLIQKHETTKTNKTTQDPMNLNP